jgi:2,3-bisphosphoglycerate-independent phosphoglycerate mutase
MPLPHPPRHGDRRVLLVFLDGIGIGRRDARSNPFLAAPLPFLDSLFDGRRPTLRASRLHAPSAVLLPLRVTLGMPGLPQSGTGQTALYTGENAAKLIGKHFGPYLYSTLKPVVARRNLFRRLQDAGLPQRDMALANAFPRRFFEYLRGNPTRMVAGMYAALTAAVSLRGITDLRNGQAVSTDITAARWKDIGHPDAPVLTPREAGRQLARIAGAHRFTLFEYFLTDKAGHERSMSHAVSILSEVDHFLHGVHDAADHGSLLVLVTSDHGNIEDLSTKSHTRNPVPLLAFGADAEYFCSPLTDICHLASAVLRFLGEE